MDWEEFNAALQLLAEERVGRRVRGAVADEDEAFNAARSVRTRG